MIEKLAWNTFKQTGNINSYLEFKEVKNIEENMNGEKNVNDKNEWNNISGK